jgi:adenylyl-sulfate kinase
MDHRNLQPHAHAVDRAQRSVLNGHAPLVLWLTGLSGSGKSTLASALEWRLVHTYQAHTYLLDGDNVRCGLNSDLSFSAPDRTENIRRIGEVAKLMFDAGLIVISAFISPFRADRERVRALFEPGQFWEIYLDCDLQTCRQRDPKQLYHKASLGQIKDFTGISSPYEPPTAPELSLDTARLDPQSCASLILQKMLQDEIIRPDQERHEPLI